MTGPPLCSPSAMIAKSPPPGGLPSFLWISCLYLFGAPRHKLSSFLPGLLRARGESILVLKGMRTRCSRVQSSLLATAELTAGAISSVLLDSDLKRVDALPVEEVLALSLQGAATVCSNAFICSFHHCFKLSVNFISFLQMSTYMKSLTRRASLTEGSVKAVKASKVKVASLTSKNADLQARVQRLAEDAMKYESDLKHTTTAKAWAEDRERKARGELRVAEDALQAVRDELQVVRDELHVVWDELRVKSMTLSRVSQEASEAMSSVERLTE